ncbi:tRNA (adenosine(37)-N6)-threonylcarbamoyltransferase complex dimerization subunit type 1 TsaB [Ahrensia sp. 13_GOM-1096m]|uniref:tRNA (adenosine(37)-N6)-threonylcarbamoyltransferase complex dimerization subunit type 1 TsaB n=1 Tax=Ahrensia sp. 13_GOM-1096m TaxID=1380380 RepID=UPI00047D8817|nr:tRNA (adenosine(37)-N6)-threonylcarbamoyltransferase complex dimerization subunit type 1 TsaB [Ahrensia sp. 13_GOM-1096m]
MTILAIDTSAHICAACLYDPQSQKILAQKSEDLGRGHAERLLSLIDECFTQAGLTPSDLTKIAVSVGPGSFTGIRVGVAAARGLALAIDVPVVGVSTFKSIAYDYVEGGASGDFAVLIKGGRSQIFAQKFVASGAEDEAPFIIADASDLEECAPLEHLQNLIGNAAAEFDAGRAVAGFDAATGSIQAYARLGAKSNLPPKPIYLRSADAKINANFALPHAAVS